jgi:DNA-binding NtrC family response regulator
MAAMVYVIDSDSDMRDLFGAVLRHVGHAVREFASLNAAEEITGESPDILLVDACLAPEGDIAAFGKVVAERYPSSDLVYLVDASNSPLKRKLERGRVRHFARPFQIEELRDLVSNLLERRSTSRR